MPLKITGYLGGRSYEDYTDVSPADLHKKLIAAGVTGIPIIDQKSDGRLSYHPSHISKDSQGRSLYPSSFGRVPETTVSLPNGDSVTVRYYLNDKGKNVDTVRERFTPSRVGFIGPNETYTLRQYDLYLFLCLCPETEGASINEDSMVRRLKIIDTKAIGDKNTKDAQTQSDAIRSIYEEDPIVLRFKASGLVVRGESVPASENESIDVIRASLVALLIKYGAAFTSVWDAPDTTLRGAILSGIGKSVIKFDAQINAWRWGAGPYESGEMMRVPNGIDPTSALITWAQSQENRLKVQDFLVLYLDGAGNLFSTSADGSKTGATVDKMIANGVIWFNPPSQSVQYMAEGKVETLTDGITNPSQWKKTLVAKINTDDALKTLVGKIYTASTKKQPA